MHLHSMLTPIPGSRPTRTSRLSARRICCSHLNRENRLSLVASVARGPWGAQSKTGTPAGRAERSASLTVDIFGNCLPSGHASEEYLSKSAVISLFWLFLLYETVLKQLFNSNNA